MDRLACVDLPALPLQLALLRRPAWREQPAAVVDQDKPQGVILWANDRARAARILPGMRYAAALSLDGNLRAAVVSAQEIDRAVTRLAERLRRFTPEVEPARHEPGVFLLDASGLQRIHESLDAWARLIREDFHGVGFNGTVVVGFNRFGCYAVSKARRGVVIFKTVREEHDAARRVPLDRLAVPPKTRDVLDRLGVRTVGGFVDLPVDGIEKRMGAEMLRLHRVAAGALNQPLQPEKPLPPVLERMHLDHPERDARRLVLAVERLLLPLLRKLVDRREALSELRVGFRFERTGDHLESIRPASPTLDSATLLELVRLRLETVRKLPDNVSEVVLVGRGTPVPKEQLALFVQKPRRDLEAANRALARVRAELGNDAVMRARLNPGHLPEASFAWEKVEKMPVAQPAPVDTGSLVRRIYRPSIPLPARPRHEPDGWMLRGLEQGPVVRAHGPYVVSGGWWRRPVHREYHFAETQKGELLWVYYDRSRRGWYLQGRVE